MLFLVRALKFGLPFTPEDIQLALCVPDWCGHIFTQVFTCLVRLESFFPPADLFLEVPLCMLAFNFRLAFVLFASLLRERFDLVLGLHLRLLMKIIGHRRQPVESLDSTRFQGR